MKHTISKMSDVKVGTLERLLQISVILGRATEDVTKLSANMTVNQINDKYNLWFKNFATPEKSMYNLLCSCHLLLKYNEQNQLPLGPSARYFSKDVDSSSAILGRFQIPFLDLK